MNSMQSASRNVLSFLQAYYLLITYGLVYVVPLYFSTATRPSPNKPRNAPGAIRARIWIVSFSTATCSLVTLIILCYFLRGWDSKTPLRSVLHLMGYWPVGFPEALRALLLTVILFAGPLYEYVFIDGAWKLLFQQGTLKLFWSDWPTWRNMITGPVTEECLFRSAVVPLLLLAADSDLKSIMFRSPLVFGLAHLHHYYEFRITHPHTPPSTAIARSVLQLCYTSIFGAYVTFIFLRTGSLLAIILVHAFCNFIGLPRLWGPVQPYWMPSSRPGSLTPAIWTYLYYFLLVVGFSLWSSLLYALTESSMALEAF